VSKGLARVPRGKWTYNIDNNEVSIDKESRIGSYFDMAGEGQTMANMDKLKEAEKQLNRGLKNLERAANLIEEAGFRLQAHDLDKWGGPIEELRDTLQDL
jgi:hypothetical protein